MGNHCHSEYCYACHAFLTLGDIPNLDLHIKYSDTRDRVDAGWLTDEMRGFMHQRLDESNQQYNFIKKKLVNEKNRKYELSLYESPQAFSDSVICTMKNYPLKDNYAVVEARHQAKMIYRNEPPEISWLNHMYKGSIWRN